MIVCSAMLAALVASVGGFEYKSRYACGVCRELQQGRPCNLFGTCDAGNASEAASGCAGVCTVVDGTESSSAIDWLELRVAKALGKKNYNMVRISVITSSAAAPAQFVFDYSTQFVHKWQQFYLHTALKEVQPNVDNLYSIGGHDVVVRLPGQGAGVAGLLIADPCVNSPTGKMWIGCQYGTKFNTIVNTPLLINTFSAGKDVDFWSIGGDNWYDRTGDISADVFSRISLEAKSKIFNTVPGNHDHWVMGSPAAGSSEDQCGNGFMQFYAQDTLAAATVMPGSTAAPFDFSIDPGAVNVGCTLAAEDNFLWYNQVGNLGMIGQNGAFSLDATRPFMQEACNWAATQPSLEVLVLFGHWDTPGLGASTEMSMPAWYTEMAALPGCSEFDKRGMLKFVMGHTHCNDPHPHGKVDAGFRVAGFGMEGCGHYGMPIVDTTESRVRFWYFDTSTTDRLNEVIACVAKSGWRACTSLATTWLDEPIAKPETEQIVV
mmetsp:Transcript_52716/g.171437  ORF Transcript_52716/g.171437 Transcript_52716/m.171437 type:complete len:490 (+) Transcript_52716:415-1884(+)|eukprot:CAMPEP_0203904614 /NCGR_PEP_ID=MMETSP0359-20131031/46416_1 /ASSEMBLY_ACC=CAM_ASM_000338 /TAXON_ID=268821 /ORGANISM="Scrippsiella Hangoei, Strain SHTV-5" /LENGTH=489 /DNA_ID=CAMNT_0050828895 /DNA_START=61 /DNA_END=1530 /DNA_ORIENTATION=-